MPTKTELQPMTTEQYRKALKKLDISHAGAGKVVGLSKRQGQRIAAGGSPVPDTVAILLRTMIKHDFTATDLG
jgi:hypothetical protein